MGGLSWNGGLPYYIEVFLESPHDPAKAKIFMCYLSFANKHVLQNNSLNKFKLIIIINY